MRPGFALICLLLVAGCKETNSVNNEDAHFLRDMETEPTPQTADLGSLFPAHPGVRFSNQYVSESFARTETTRFVGMRRLGSRTCAVFESLNSDGKPYRTEWYEIRPDGVYLAQAGGSDRIALDPPFLVLPNPLQAEREHPWEGVMTFRGIAMPARGSTRFRDQLPMSLPIGTVNAVRVESVLRAMVDGRTITFPTTRWFAPGYGIVRSDFQVDRSAFRREMARWLGPAPKEKTTPNTGDTG